MRVISGIYKGKKLEGFDIDGTRPTMDRVKESLFASIQNYVKGSVVLDLFAGSGALGIEALSNGSLECTFVDHNNIVINILKKNTMNMKGVKILKSDYKEALSNFKLNNNKFDLIILDPPYKLNLINECLGLIYKYELLNLNGIIVCEYETEVLNFDKYDIIKEKKYSSKCITIYKRVK